MIVPSTIALRGRKYTRKEDMIYHTLEIKLPYTTNHLIYARDIETAMSLVLSIMLFSG